VNTSSLDLKLLLVFNTLMSERSVTRAAHRLGLTQPAISNALRRLREALDDELFHRSGDGMRPTPRAMELATPVRQVLRQFEAVFHPPAFEPGESNRHFRLAISPPVALILLPALSRRLRRKAPGVTLWAQSTPSMQASMLLDGQTVDLVIGVVPDAPSRFPRRTLYRETYVALMRADHPLADGQASLEQVVAAHHLLVTQTQQQVNLFDDAIARMGLKRGIAMSVTDWQTAAEVLSGTDLITAAFHRTAEAVTRASGGRLAIRPLGLPSFEIIMFWHDSFSRHPAYEWLQQEIVEAIAETAL
jgi:DNA-binding transcriptional LysR family regulator